MTDDDRGANLKRQKPYLPIKELTVHTLVIHGNRTRRRMVTSSRILVTENASESACQSKSCEGPTNPNCWRLCMIQGEVRFMNVKTECVMTRSGSQAFLHLWFLFPCHEQLSDLLKYFQSNLVELWIHWSVSSYVALVSICPTYSNEDPDSNEYLD